MSKYLTICLGLVMPVFLCAQSSLTDLDRSDHRTRYHGDSALLIALTEPLRGANSYILSVRSEICEEEVTEVGKLLVHGVTYRLLHVETSFGNSCKGINNLLFFKGEMLYGSYRNDNSMRLKILGNELHFLERYGKKVTGTYNFTSGFPENIGTSAAFGGFKKWNE